jgi:hypothetical protein
MSGVNSFFSWPVRNSTGANDIKVTRIEKNTARPMVRDEAWMMRSLSSSLNSLVFLMISFI